MAVRQVVTGQFAQLLVIQRVEVALQQLTIDVRLGITVIRYRGRRHRMAAALSWCLGLPEARAFPALGHVLRPGSQETQSPSRP